MKVCWCFIGNPLRDKLACSDAIAAWSTIKFARAVLFTIELWYLLYNSSYMSVHSRKWGVVTGATFQICRTVNPTPFPFSVCSSFTRRLPLHASSEDVDSLYWGDYLKHPPLHPCFLFLLSRLSRALWELHHLKGVVLHQGITIQNLLDTTY